MRINDFLCFLWLSWCHYGPKFVQVGCNLAQVSSKVNREGSSCHQHSPSWCQHGLKRPKLASECLHGSPSARQSGTKWLQIGSNMGEVRLKTAQSESKLSLSGPKLLPNWYKMASILHEGGKSKNAWKTNENQWFSMFSVLQFVSIWLQVGSSLPKLATNWLK